MKQFVGIIVFVLLCQLAYSQPKKFAVGVRLGEPSGLNARYYLEDGERAIDVNIGTYGGLWGNVRSYRSGYYKNVGLAISANYLFMHQLFGKEQVMGYYGFGGQINSRRYYPDQFNQSGQVFYDKTISLGGSGLGGIEYFLPDRPLSIFLDAGLYVEVLPGFLFMHQQIGTGVRLNL
ncbi:MAG: hypothetical protein U0Y10_19460 [Spirosomataceae bacterium]